VRGNLYFTFYRFFSAKKKLRLFHKIKEEILLLYPAFPPNVKTRFERVFVVKVRIN